MKHLRPPDIRLRTISLTICAKAHPSNYVVYDFLMFHSTRLLYALGLVFVMVVSTAILRIRAFLEFEPYALCLEQMRADDQLGCIKIEQRYIVPGSE